MTFKIPFYTVKKGLISQVVHSFICFLIIISLSSNVFGQQWSVEVMGGVGPTFVTNARTPANLNSLSTSMTVGECFGIGFSDSLSQGLKLGFGFLYAIHNESYYGQTANGDLFKAKIKFHFLDIPLLLRMGKPLGPFFEIGPQLSILLGANEDASINGVSVESNKDFSGDYSNLNLMAVAGFGANVPVRKNVTFNLGFRLGYGLTDLTNESVGGTNHSLPSFIANSGKYSATNRIYINLLGALIFAIP